MPLSREEATELLHLLKGPIQTKELSEFVESIALDAFVSTATPHEKAAGDAINRALYNTTSDGKKNMPCLSERQKIAAARAAIEAIQGD